MPRYQFPVGNQAGIGNSGGGRKTAYDEKRDAAWFAKVWELESEIEKLEKKIEAGKYSIRDMWLYKVLKGNERLLHQASERMLPMVPKFDGDDAPNFAYIIKRGLETIVTEKVNETNAPLIQASETVAICSPSSVTSAVEAPPTESSSK